MKLKLLIATAAVLGVLVIWQLMQGSDPPIDSIDARMEKLRQAGDDPGLTRLDGSCLRRYSGD